MQSFSRLYDGWDWCSPERTGEDHSQIFRSAGVLDMDYDVVALLSLDADPFFEADVVQMELEGLIEGAVPGERCSVEEYVEGDDRLTVCTDLDGEKKEANNQT